jgi:D-glycero-D-manno-heptose 1,7-bisphosphate phosphatase
VYYHEHGIIDSPFTAEQFSLKDGVGEAIRKLRENDYKVILVSNQPGIAKGFFSRDTFRQIRDRMNDLLTVSGAALDGEYYCLHHPEAEIPELRMNCECRKPEPGLLLKAAREMDIDLSQSWMAGDGITDIQAGKRAGCRTILIGRMKCELCEMMDELDAVPDFIAPNLGKAADYIQKKGDQQWKSSLIQQASIKSENG